MSPHHIDIQIQPLMGSEDFSRILALVPGAMAFLGACPANTGPDKAAPMHSSHMVMNESVLPIGSALHCAVALNYLGTPLPHENSLLYHTHPTARRNA